MSEQERRQQASAAAMKSFAGAFARGQANALDRFGQPIQEGDKMMLRFQVDPILDVVSVNPVLDPRAQPGTIQVMCTVTFPLIVPAGQPFQAAHIVARRQETQPLGGSDNGKGSALSLVETPPDSLLGSDPAPHPFPEDDLPD